MKRILDGHDLTYSQINGLSSLFGEPGRAMPVTNNKLRETGMSEDEVEDLVNKGYLELLTNGDYLLPRDTCGNVIISRLTERGNDERIRQMNSRMF